MPRKRKQDDDVKPSNIVSLEKEAINSVTTKRSKLNEKDEKDAKHEKNAKVQETQKEPNDNMATIQAFLAQNKPVTNEKDTVSQPPVVVFSSSSSSSSSSAVPLPTKPTFVPQDTMAILTRYNRCAVISMRAEALALGAPPVIVLGDDCVDAIEIATMEVDAGLAIPFGRPLPFGKPELVSTQFLHRFF